MDKNWGVYKKLTLIIFFKANSMLEVNIYKSKHTWTNVMSRCSGKGFHWEQQVMGSIPNYILGFFKWYLMIYGIFYGSSCADARVVTQYQLKLCWNDIETGLQRIQQVSGCIRRVSRRIQHVSLTESSSQTYKYVRIRQLEYPMWIAHKSHPYLYQIRLGFEESVQHRNFL
jgi:hypothetical protein